MPKTSKKYDYDLFVIGGGSGGIRAARWAARLGAKTAVCEKDRLGGTCVIRGCIPKKLMVYGSHFAKEFETARAYGWELGKPKLDWEKFNRARNQEISRLEGVYADLLKRSGVDLICGEGRLKGPHAVEVNSGGQKGKAAAKAQSGDFSARYILIAAGGRPRILPIEGAAHALTSDDMFSLERRPRSFLALGAGYIALEFASIFHGLGAETALMFRKDFILSGFDRDLRRRLQEELSRRGISMLPKRNPVKIEKKGGVLSLTDDRGETRQAEAVLMAAGRLANTQNLNLKALGIGASPQGQIPVSGQFQTSCPSVFAVGDCAQTPFQLTPVALAEGMFVSDLLFGKTGGRQNSGKGGSKAKEGKEPEAKGAAAQTAEGFSYEAIPSAVFTQPEAGTAGLSEDQALEAGLHVEIFESRFRPLKLTLADQREKAYMKLVVCKKSQRVLGCHIVGEGAAEMLQGFAVAIKNRLAKKDFDKTIGIHPSSAEELVTMREPARSAAPP